eukprot:CAMPEP_0194410042 /NCGR_PEP_ID=MMETSP0176-20130528/8029_1 /TAXON_ID=216777 /ORGANISM="Proboscia alata, Strain PI-D3" /LENGTH=36 /DNA_ID= /DNA_START= /DNA_END= /DNA_ORIENTATION=
MTIRSSPSTFSTRNNTKKKRNAKHTQGDNNLLPSTL